MADCASHSPDHMAAAMAVTTNYETRGLLVAKGRPPRVFFARWQRREEGLERANHAVFLTELCAVLSLSPPDPTSAAHGTNAFLSVWRVRSTTAAERYDEEKLLSGDSNDLGSIGQLKRRKERLWITRC